MSSNLPAGSDSHPPDDLLDDETEPCADCGAPISWDEAAQTYRHHGPACHLATTSGWLPGVIPRTYHVDDETGDVPIVTLLETMPENGSAVVIGDETGSGSLWLEWAHHGDVRIP